MGCGIWGWGITDPVPTDWRMIVFSIIHGSFNSLCFICVTHSFILWLIRLNSFQKTWLSACVDTGALRVRPLCRVFMYLFERQRVGWGGGREYERAPDSPLMCCLALQVPAESVGVLEWVGLKLRAGNSIRVSYTGGRNPVTRAIIPCFPGSRFLEVGIGN